MDECSEDTVGCAQTCTNTDGSFECSCGTGYTLSADNFGCDGKLRHTITYLSRMVIGDCPSYSYPHIIINLTSEHCRASSEMISGIVSCVHDRKILIDSLVWGSLCSPNYAWLKT